MKRILFLLFILTGVASSFAVNPQWEKFRKLQYRYPSGNFEPGKFQSITGCFDGKTKDTITLFPYDGEWEPDIESGDDYFFYDKWILISKNKTVPSTIINSYHPVLVFEGDLDGNGRDEFGVLLTGLHGAWCDYCVYTLYNNSLKEFLNVYWWDGNEDDYRGIVRKGSRRGEVKYYTYKHTSDNIRKLLKTVYITKFLK